MFLIVTSEHLSTLLVIGWLWYLFVVNRPVQWPSGQYCFVGRMFHYLPKFFTLPLYKVYWNPCCLDTGHPKIPTCRHRLGKQTSSIKHGHLVSCDYYVYYLSITHRPSVLIPPFGARNDGFCCPSTGHHLTIQTCLLKCLSLISSEPRSMSVLHLN